MNEKTYHPGEKVPQSGIYRCDCSESHEFTSTDVEGKTFPPLPSACTGHSWVLKTPAHPG
ncbi:hypothetical protein [Streptomyces sp. NPDC051776]|uniref:hypothetical protein n=1 Tax=Streptomyces sp. NPDC051776 TaxID=3155414 RepID=UPI00341BD86F